MEQVEENLRIASDARVGDFSEDDMDVIEKIKRSIRVHEKVGCTGCRYCMPCPRGVDIPGIFYHYNLCGLEPKSSARLEFVRVIAMKVDSGVATKCIGCGKCETHCPQHLDIRNKLVEADKMLCPLPYKAGIYVARNIMLHK